MNPLPIFKFASDDQSCMYLRQIFGSMNGVVCNPQNDPDMGISLLGTMFQTFNTIVLAVAALMVLYVTVVGVMQTAHEGEFMGKKWNNIWIPIRMVFGIAFLVPTGSGYSALQLIIMWFIVQGIGAADTLWASALGYVNVVGSPYGQMNIPTIGSDQNIKQLFQVQVCDATTAINKPEPNPGGGGPYFCAVNPTDPFCRRTSIATSSLDNLAKCSNDKCVLAFGPGPGKCGNLTYCNEATVCTGADRTSLKCAACKAQGAALDKIVQTFAGLAQGFAQADYTYRSFYAKSFLESNNPDWAWIYSYCQNQPVPIKQSDCCERSTNPLIIQSCPPTATSFPSPNMTAPGFPAGNAQGANSEVVKNFYLPYGIPALSTGVGPAFLSTSAQYYASEVQKGVQEWLAAQGKKTQLSGGLDDAKKVGWIFAGGYYYTIAGMNKSQTKESMPTFTAEVKDATSTGLSAYRNNLTAAQVLTAASAEGSAGSMFGSSEALSALQGPIDSISNSLSSSLSGALGQAGVSGTSIDVETGGKSGGLDPISQLIITGNVLLSVAPLIFSILVPITIVTTLLGYLSPFGLGTGFVNPSGPSYFAVMALFIMPALYGLMALMISLGGLLGIYVPLIPYIVFTFGAIGWMISTIEAMVAGPLVALGIISPSGQHEIMGKAEPAIMLIFNVFLRPSLMIFGFMAAILLAKIVLGMVNYTFWHLAVANIKPYGLLQIIIVFAAYVTLVVSVLNKCFAAIYIIPQQVMLWIGGQGAQYGEAEALGEMKHGTTGAAEKAGAAASGAQSTAPGAVKGTLKMQEGARQRLAEKEKEEMKLKGQS